MQRDRGEHLVRARPESAASIAAASRAVGRLAEDLAVERDGRVGGEHRRERQVALAACAASRPRALARATRST